MSASRYRIYRIWSKCFGEEKIGWWMTLNPRGEVDYYAKTSEELIDMLPKGVPYVVIP